MWLCRPLSSEPLSLTSFYYHRENAWPPTCSVPPAIQTVVRAVLAMSTYPSGSQASKTYCPPSMPVVAGYKFMAYFSPFHSGSIHRRGKSKLLWVSPFSLFWSLWSMLLVFSFTFPNDKLDFLMDQPHLVT